MKKLPLCPSSWAEQFPFAPFPQDLLFFPVYKIDANDLCPPCADMQGLTLSLAPTGATELCSNHVNTLIDFFLNKEPKLLALEAL